MYLRGSKIKKKTVIVYFKSELKPKSLFIYEELAPQSNANVQ